MMKALVLDFDGVISNSAAESFLVALLTYCRLRPDSSLAREASELEQRWGARPQTHPAFSRFLDLMPLGNRAEDFAMALWLIDNNITVADQEEYAHHRSSHDHEFLQRFHQRFYQERRRLCERDRDGWLGLLSPYPAFVELLSRRFADTTLALATAKDAGSVRLLLASYGLTALFPEERILDKDTGADKRSHLEVLQSRLGFDFAELTFVDDKVNHLDSVSRLGVRCGLAAWGYNGERERKLAASRGYLVCTLENAESQLFVDG